MFYNLKIALRNLRRNGMYSVINICGLAVALTAVILILLWVQDELSFDKFHKHAKNIYTVNSEMNGNFWTTTPAPMAIHAVVENPEIENACRIGWYSVGYLEYENKKFYSIDYRAVDSSFFKIFSFPLIEGNPAKPFIDDQSIIISETKAKTIFGDENPIGKLVKTNTGNSLQISGVMKDFPKNSTITADAVVPFATLQSRYGGNGPWKRIDDDWGNYSYNTYLLLEKHAESKTVADKLGKMTTRLRSEEGTTFGLEFHFGLQPLTSLHLYAPDGKPAGMEKVRLFTIISVLILIIACINYVNLVTARAGKRNKEMGVRKVIGAKRSDLVSRLMGETVLLLLLSLIISTILVYVLLPFYNELSGKEMAFHIFGGSTLAIYGITILSVLALAGIYPAFFLASFKPVDAMKSGFSGGRQNKHAWIRKSLVVFQFACSVGLIMSTIVISMQVDFLRKKDLGYNREHVFTVPAIRKFGSFESLKHELMKNPTITGVTSANANYMAINSSKGGVLWPGKNPDPNFDLIFRYQHVPNNFPEVMGIPVIAGDIPPGSDSEKKVEYILLNEEAVRVMQLKEPVGSRICLDAMNPNDPNNEYLTVAAVVKDYNFDLLSRPVDPLILVCSNRMMSFLYIRTTTVGAQSAIATVEKLWKQYNPDYEFSYNFLDEQFDRFYKADMRLQRLLYIFAGIAIFLSCLGLFGLVTFTAEIKTKEIGIRKVLGASVGNVVHLLSKDFLAPICIAILIAFPIAYYWLTDMLQDYAYRISISWWMFVLAALVMIIITLVTVSWQAFRAATANPIKAIKTE